MASVAVVTGGTGFIGWNLCERLLDDGWAVRAPVRSSSANPLPDGVTRVVADLDASELAAACADADAVFHLAGLTRAHRYEEFRRVNEEGTLAVARAAAAAEAFLVYVSSQAAAGPGTPASPRTESDPPEPVSMYGRSKLAGELALATVAGLRYTVVRPPGVYGPRDRDFLSLFRMARRGLAPLLGDPATSYTFAHVDDVVEALVTVAAAGARPGAHGQTHAVHGQTYFVGHPEPVSQHELVAILGRALDRRVRSLPVPRPVLWSLAQLGEVAGALGRPALVNRSRYRELTAPGFVCSVDKIARELGVRAAVDTDEGFARTAQWYREQGLLR